MALKILISLSPVILFLSMLIFLDSIKLVQKKLLCVCLLWGFISAGLSYLINTSIIPLLDMDFREYSIFVAPVPEEILKLLLILFLIRKNKIGFMIDAAIYGFAIGTTFSLVENAYYLIQYGSEFSSLIVWLIRGVGTALMHGSTVAILGISAVGQLNSQRNPMVFTGAGILLAIGIHSLFNFLVDIPVLSVVLSLFILPLFIIALFSRNEKSIRNWLEIELDAEIQMLRMIREGKFSQTKTGRFLLHLKSHFSAGLVVDMYCYIRIYLELSVKAKGIMMLREAGLPCQSDPEIPDQLAELTYLEKSIGRSGLLAIQPILRMNRKDIWKLSLLQKTAKTKKTAIFKYIHQL